MTLLIPHATYPLVVERYKISWKQSYDAETMRQHTTSQRMQYMYVKKRKLDNKHHQQPSNHRHKTTTQRQWDNTLHRNGCSTAVYIRNKKEIGQKSTTSSHPASRPSQPSSVCWYTRARQQQQWHHWTNQRTRTSPYTSCPTWYFVYHNNKKRVYCLLL